MRVRRDVARQWEKNNPREYLHGGEGKGSEKAAWMMAARAEAAAANKQEYGQVLLDLVKAFETVRHDRLIDGALRLGYPLKMLKLSIDAYMLSRRVMIGGAFSREVQPGRGIGAGSGLATTELKLIMIIVADEVHRTYAGISMTIWVDDTTLEAVGDERSVVEQSVGCTNAFCKGLTEVGMFPSEEKNVCTASRPEIGRRIAERLCDWFVRYQGGVMGLGIGMGAGKRRRAGS